MKNPITQNIRNSLIYTAIWVVVLGIHVATLYYLYETTFQVAIVDGIVFDTVFAFLGIAIWYPVFYNDLEKNTFTNLIINHLIIMSLTLVFWISLCMFLMKLIFPEAEVNLVSLDKGIPWRIFSGTFFYFAIIMVYYLLIYGYNLREHIIQESKLKEQIYNAELETLKAQINPHFLFNSLNSISSFTITNPEKAHEMIIRLSGFLRYSLSHDPNHLISLQKEIENMESYISIEKIRFGDKLIFKKDIDKKCNEHKVPFLILQPLIENAIKHGVYESIKPININISCKEIEDEKVKIVLINDFDPKAISRKGTGTGLKNIKERLKLIYQLSDLITFERGENSFKVVLVLPHKAMLKTQEHSRLI